MKQIFCFGFILTLSLLISPLSYGRGGVIGGGSTGGGLSWSGPPQSQQFRDRPYTPTKGLNRCEEGHIEYAQKFGQNGNPFARDLICRNGKMVPLD